MNFKINQLVVHKSTRNLYCILGTPDQGYIIEQSQEKAYLYYPFNNKKIIWIRSKSEMEDGRFILFPDFLHCLMERNLEKDGN